jgi:hypothetical protein
VAPTPNPQLKNPPPPPPLPPTANPVGNPPPPTTTIHNHRNPTRNSINQTLPQSPTLAHPPSPLLLQQAQSNLHKSLRSHSQTLALLHHLHTAFTCLNAALLCSPTAASALT